jgi:hypothetical protein
VWYVISDECMLLEMCVTCMLLEIRGTSAGFKCNSTGFTTAQASALNPTSHTHEQLQFLKNSVWNSVWNYLSGKNHRTSSHEYVAPSPTGTLVPRRSPESDATLPRVGGRGRLHIFCWQVGAGADHFLSTPHVSDGAPSRKKPSEHVKSAVAFSIVRRHTTMRSWCLACMVLETASASFTSCTKWDPMTILDRRHPPAQDPFCHQNVQMHLTNVA